jgi:hypothetical protein
VVSSSCGGDCNACCEESRWSKLRGRLRGLFHRNDECCDSGCATGGCTTGCASPGCGTTIHGVPAAPGVMPGAPAAPRGEPIPAPKVEPKKMPAAPAATQIIVPQPVISGTSHVIPREGNRPFEPSRRYDRVSYAPDFSWLTGQLSYVHADGGLWLLRYAPLSQEDPNGGSVVLARDLSMARFREGDLVTVHGQVISEHSSKFLGAPLYRVNSIQLVERKPR